MPSSFVRPRLVSSCALGVLALTAYAARADAPVRTRLIYSADDPRGVCVDEATFRTLVTSRLGYDSFQDDATWIFRVHFDARSTRPRAAIVTEQDGASLGRRTLEDASCQALAETVASAIAVAVDPLAGAPRRAEPPPPLPPPPAAKAPAPAATAPAPAAPEAAAIAKEAPPEPSHPVAAFVSLRGTGTIGRVGGPALGGRVAGGLSYRALSVALEARAEATPGAVTLETGERTTWSVFGGGLAVCGHKSVLSLCALGSVGSLQAKAENVSRPSLKGTLLGVVGTRVGVMFPIAKDVGVGGDLELGVPLVRTTFFIDGKPAWTAPAVQASVALGVEVSFR